MKKYDKIEKNNIKYDKIAKNNITINLIIFLLLTLTSSCSQKRVDPPPQAKEPEIPEQSPPMEGSLFVEGSPFSNMYSDLKAFRPGDIVVVRIIENTVSQNENRTEMTRDSNFSSGL